jgi:hypothetical protein
MTRRRQRHKARAAPGKLARCLRHILNVFRSQVPASRRGFSLVHCRED